MQKVGIIVPGLYNHQLFFEAAQNAKYIDANLDLIIFYEDLSPVSFRPPCAFMPTTEILNFNGLLISTTLTNTLLSIKAINMAKKVFYIWDLEWIRNNKNYLHNISIYQNPEIQCITRSQEYANELNNYANIQPKVSKLDIKDILSCVQQYQKKT